MGPKKPKTKDNPGNIEAEVEEDQVEVVELYCPCKKWRESEYIYCEKVDCKTWWHIECVTLGQLSKGNIEKLKWHCPRCIMASLPKSEKEIQTDEESISDMVKAEVMKILPDLVENVVEKTEKKKNKQWSAIVKKNQEQTQKTIEDSMTGAMTKNQEEILNKAAAKQDADNYERSKRARNVVIKGVRESKRRTPGQPTKSDTAKVSAVLDLDEEDIENVVRAGAVNGDTPRPIIVTVSTPSLASELHGFGRGIRVIDKKTKEEMWINPDLILADRIANKNARDVKRAKKLKRENNNTEKTPQAKEVPVGATASVEQKQQATTDSNTSSTSTDSNKASTSTVEPSTSSVGSSNVVGKDRKQLPGYLEKRAEINAGKFKINSRTIPESEEESDDLFS